MRRHKLKGGMVDDTPMEDQVSYMVNPAAESDVDGGDVTPGPMTRRGRAKASVSNVGAGVKSGVTGAGRGVKSGVMGAGRGVKSGASKLKVLLSTSEVDGREAEGDAETVSQIADKTGINFSRPQVGSLVASLKTKMSKTSDNPARDTEGIDDDIVSLDKNTRSLAQRLLKTTTGENRRLVKAVLEVRIPMRSKSIADREEELEEELAYQAELEKFPLSDQPDANSQSILKRQAAALGVTVDDKGNIVEHDF